jgi:ribosomal subunit interface protein
MQSCSDEETSDHENERAGGGHCGGVMTRVQPTPAMEPPLQITFRNMAALPSVEPEIRRRADKLDQWTPDVMSCHVVVEAEGNRHRTGHEYRVHISVRVPGEEIAVGSHHLDEDIHRAVHGAFDAADRQLEDYVRRRRGQVKQHRVASETDAPESTPPDDEANAPRSP